MIVEDKTGKTIEILMDQFGNKKGDVIVVERSDRNSIWYTDGKGRACRFMNHQEGQAFRYKEISKEEALATLQEAAETPAEPPAAEDEGDEAEGEADEAAEAEEAEEAVKEEAAPEEKPKKKATSKK